MERKNAGPRRAKTRSKAPLGNSSTKVLGSMFLNICRYQMDNLIESPPKSGTAQAIWVKGYEAIPGNTRRECKTGLESRRRVFLQAVI